MESTKKTCIVSRYLLNETLYDFETSYVAMYIEKKKILFLW